MKKLFILAIFFGILGAVFFSKAQFAQAQTCTTTAPTNTGKVALSATIPSSGTYRVWARMKIPNTTNNSFYLQIDGGCPILVGGNSSISANTWTWVDYQNGNTSSKINSSLSAGDHDLIIIGNGTGVGVDKLLLTPNLSCVPTGISGDNCPAVTPSPTSTPDTSPPTFSGVSTSEITDTTAKITWTLSEPGTGQIEYGPTTAYGSLSAPENSFNYTTHIQTISGLNPGTTYNYRLKTKDQAGNQALSSNFTFKTTGGVTNIPVSNTPSISQSPSLTPGGSGTTTLKFQSIKMHGIGLGGNNKNPNALENPSPLRTTRELTLELEDTKGNTLPQIKSNITYRPISGTTGGDFTGEITIPSSTPPGFYVVKIKSPQFMRKRVLGILEIKPEGTIVNYDNIALINGDINNDNALSILDYNILTDCYSGFLPAKNCDDAKKLAADLTDDGNVDNNDFNLFIKEISVVSGD